MKLFQGIKKKTIKMRKYYIFIFITFFSCNNSEFMKEIELEHEILRRNQGKIYDYSKVKILDVEKVSFAEIVERELIRLIKSVSTYDKLIYENEIKQEEIRSNLINLILKMNQSKRNFDSCKDINTGNLNEKLKDEFIEYTCLTYKTQYLEYKIEKEQMVKDSLKNRMVMINSKGTKADDISKKEEIKNIIDKNNAYESDNFIIKHVISISFRDSIIHDTMHFVSINNSQLTYIIENPMLNLILNTY